MKETSCEDSLKIVVYERIFADKFTSAEGLVISLGKAVGFIADGLQKLKFG